tara:strand:- start:473 stop:766 length:294 start_codon:yes stop_codon:yes gene_type:complete
MQSNNKWWVYIDGYRVAETKSIGYKWVYYKTAYGRYKKISRAKWDKACISTLNDQQTKLDIQNRARDLGISFIKKSRKKFGWSYKTFDEIKFEVESA